VRPRRLRAGAGASATPAGSSPAPTTRWDPRRASIALALVLTLVLVGLHLVFHAHAGPLWRDEVNSVNVASSPSLSDVFARARFDSFPAAWTAILHLSLGLGSGDADRDGRRLGLVIGLVTIASVWWAGRRLGVAAPVVALLLFAMSPSVIIYGDAVRGYGLGAAALLWCAGSLWAYVERPGARRLALAFMASLAAVQTHYANCLLLLAAGAGAAAVVLRERNFRALASLALLGMGAALSVVIVNRGALEYMTQTAPLIVATWPTAFLIEVFAHAIGAGVTPLSIAWALAGVLALAGLALAFRPGSDPADVDRALFCGVTIILGLVVYFIALRSTGVGIQYWHYLSLMGLCALILDVGSGLFAARWWWGGWARVAIVAVLALASVRDVAEAVRLRMTDVDLAAREIARRGGPGDLVVVLPWYAGVTFDRYYRGSTPWITIPDLPEHKVHTHLAIRDRMKIGSRAVDDELSRVERVLRGGGQVFVVGVVAAPDQGAPPAELPAAPGGPRGWHADPYLESWELQLGALLERHGVERERVTLPPVGSVNAWESLPVGVVRGWR